MTEASPVQAYALATRLLIAMLAEPIVLSGVTVHLTASVGLTDLAGGANGDDVMRRADLALRRAKQLGRGRVEWYDEAVEEAMVRRGTPGTGAAGRPAAAGELDLHVPADPGPRRGPAARGRGAAAVAASAAAARSCRRHHPVAETLGLIDEIGSWVLRQACRQLATWLGEGRDLSMAVNVSPRQLDGPGARHRRGGRAGPLRPAGRPARARSRRGRARHRTPSRPRRTAGRPALARRTDALDDFGTGPESLTHLRRLPMDMVKIGRSFFDSPCERPNQPAPDHRRDGRPRSAARHRGRRPGTRGAGRISTSYGPPGAARAGSPVRPPPAGGARRGLPRRLSGSLRSRVWGTERGGRGAVRRYARPGRDRASSDDGGRAGAGGRGSWARLPGSTRSTTGARSTCCGPALMLDALARHLGEDAIMVYSSRAGICSPMRT